MPTTTEYTPDSPGAPGGTDGNQASAKPDERLAQEDLNYLHERAVDVDLALREGIRTGFLDIPAADDNYHLGRNYKDYPGTCRIYARHLVVPYQSCLDKIPRIRLRMHETRVVIAPAEEEGGNVLSAQKEAIYPRWLAQKDVPVVPYLPSYIDRPWKTAKGNNPLSEDTTQPLFITEAPIKALALASHGFPAIAMAGVEAGFLDTSKSLKKKGVLVLQSELGRIAWQGRRVFICYDAGIWNNPAVARGAARLAMVLRNEGADPWLVPLPLFRLVDARKEAADLELSDDARMGEMIDDCMSRGGGEESYAGCVKDSGDQGPDDYLARWHRYARALRQPDEKAYATSSFQRMVEGAVPADAGRWASCVRDQSHTKVARTAALTDLLCGLPFQALLAVGGEGAIEAVAACGLGKKTVQEAVGRFQARVVDQVKTGEPDWAGDLARGSEGTVLPVAENILTILRHDDKWKGCLAYDQFGERTVFRKAPPWDADYSSSTPFTDGQQVIESDAMRLIAWMGKHYGIRFTVPMAHAIIDVAAERNGYHPVRDFLAGLTWDGVGRMSGTEDSGWLTTYLGVEDCPYVRRVGRIWLVSMIARVMKPGCVVKTVPILEGPQDGFKSTVCRVLAAPWGSDSLSDPGTKDSYQDLRSKWLVELGELAGMARATVVDLKHFTSKPVDNYRESYGRRNRDVPRQCIFVGTTNASEYLRDNTGGSRFLPVKVGRIDIDRLGIDRDQLLAEAMAAYKAGEKWWVDRQEDGILAAVRDEQEARREVHPWEDKIRAWVTGRPSVSTLEVLEDALNLDAGKVKGADGKLVSSILVHVLGWAKGKDTAGCSRYFNPTPPADSTVANGQVVPEVEAAVRVIRDAGYEVEISTASDGCNIRVRRTVQQDEDSLFDAV